MPTPCWDSLLIDGDDIQDVAWITSAEGLLSQPPYKGDLIESDWRDTAVWQKGPQATYSFDVPVVMNSTVQDVALAHLRTLQALQGQEVSLTRRLTVNGAQIAEQCQAVMISAVQVRWDFARRAQVHAVLVFQTLGPWFPHLGPVTS